MKLIVRQAEEDLAKSLAQIKLTLQGTQGTVLVYP